MSAIARSYIFANIALGAILVASSLLCSWRSPNPERLVAYILLTAVASTLKVRLPGYTGTISLSFLFVLISLVEFDLSETVLVAACGAAVQSVWRRKTRPNVVQVGFNIAVLSTSAAFAFSFGRMLLPSRAQGYLPILLALGATLFFFTNTFLISGVISLVERQAFLGVWRRCHLWTFPYYVAGAAFAGLMSICNRTVGWRVGLLALPAVYFVYVFYKQCVIRLAPPA